MKINSGDFIKAVGGDFGIVYRNGKWHSFECLGCAYAAGLLKTRLSNGDHPQLIKKLGYNYEYRHDAKVHGDWLNAGKPVIFK